MYILDTNVLIDLWHGEILDAFFQSLHPLAAPDVIIAELQSPDGQELVRLGLQSMELTGEQLTTAVHLQAKNPGRTVNDIFALVLAEIHTATLLTGDRALRDLAQLRGLPVHGTLWVLDELVRLCALPPAKAAAALLRMMEKGSRLPEAECRRRIEKWRGR
jgi:predicted nucleic acid-binding protein